MNTYKSIGRRLLSAVFAAVVTIVAGVPKHLLVMFGLAALSQAGMIGRAAAQDMGSRTYSSYEVRQQQVLSTGVVEDLRVVHIKVQDNVSYAGTAIGAGLGGLAANRVGQGNGRIAAVLIGSAIGGTIGNRFANGPQYRDATEIIVHIDQGPVVAVVQENDGADLRIGDKVRLIGGASTRVVRMGNTVPIASAAVRLAGY
jgi:outer membrane lipoprotein SlyB